MTSRPLISVLIPAYNAAPYLAEAIDSAFGQTHQPVEVIVVDDGSEDGTEAVARAYGDRIFFERLEHRGIGSARNRAVELSHGDYLAFLDADDRFLPTKLEHQLAALESDSELDIVFGFIHEFISPDVPPETQATMRRPAPASPWTGPNVMLIRREAFDRVGAFSTDFRVGEGIDWYARAAEAGLKSLMLREVVLERRLHGQNSSVREPQSRSDYLQVVRSAVERRRARDAGSSEAT
jgi:glycosyltransferase involved in cell wall biosynthesis